MKNVAGVVILLICFTALVFGYISYGQLKQEKLEFLSITEKYELVKKQISDIKNKITDIEHQSSALMGDIETTQLRLDSYNNEYTTLKGQKTQIMELLLNKRCALNNRQAQLTQMEQQKKDLSDEVEELVLARQNLDNEFKELTKVKRQIEDDIKTYIKPKKGIELDKIIVKMSNVPDGSIVDINQKYGFALIDVGREDGVIVGDMLDVYRGVDYIAKVIVEKLFTDAAVVVPAEGFTDVKLFISDKVILSE